MVKVVIEGDPVAWGKRFTELVCQEWCQEKEGHQADEDDDGGEEGTA